MALGETSSALVERFAHLAPRPIKNESVIRVSGWLNEQPGAAIRSPPASANCPSTM